MNEKEIKQRDALLIDLAESLKREDNAILFEREECAKIADEIAFVLFGDKKELMKRVARDIRMRSNVQGDRLRAPTDKQGDEE